MKPESPASGFPTLGRLLKSAAFIFICVYLVVFFYLYFNQQYMMYPGASWGRPSDEQADLPPPKILKEGGFDYWRDAAGFYQGLKKEDPRATANWVYFHGNGDNAFSALSWNNVLEQAYPGRQWNFYVLQYPGYGSRPGSPSETSITEAATTALSSLSRPDLPLYIAGQSLGSGVAVRTVISSGTEAEALLLITPFTSMTDAAHVFLQRSLGPFSHLIPLPILLKDTWNSLNSIDQFTGRTVIVGTSQDPITPAWMSVKLGSATPEPKRILIQDSGNHFIDWDRIENSTGLWNFIWPQEENSGPKEEKQATP